jgi:hypothetical protein
MAQISRPFQVVIVVFVLFVGAYAAWFLVLRTPAPSTPTPVATSPAPAPRIHTLKTPESGKVYHGAAPGLEGLTRDVAKAHGAVSAAQARGEHELAQGGAAPSRASSTATGSAATPTAPATHAPATHASTRAAPSSTAAASIAKPAQHSAAKSTTSTPAPSRSKTAQAPSNLSQVPARQAQVEHALKEGKIAVILFWNPKGADDVADQAELRLLEAVHRLIPGLARRVPAVRAELKHSGLELEKKFAAFEARADQVTSFGTITRGVQVYETPTLLVVNPSGQVTAITGLTDAFAIEQAIDEARHA